MLINRPYSSALMSFVGVALALAVAFCVSVAGTPSPCTNDMTGTQNVKTHADVPNLYAGYNADDRNAVSNQYHRYNNTNSSRVDWPSNHLKHNKRAHRQRRYCRPYPRKSVCTCTCEERPEPSYVRNNWNRDYRFLVDTVLL
jgi:hypothetical protein